MGDDEPDNGRNKLMFFGRNIAEIPCFKYAFTTGLVWGIGFGLGHFLFTSRARRSTDLAVYSFVAITGCSWFYCRYNWSKQKFEYKKIQKEMKEIMQNEGVEQVNAEVTK